jgi:hypothetical protein
VPDPLITGEISPLQYFAQYYDIVFFHGFHSLNVCFLHHSEYRPLVKLPRDIFVFFLTEVDARAFFALLRLRARSKKLLYK